jgi:hypothetical protein
MPGGVSGTGERLNLQRRICSPTAVFQFDVPSAYADAGDADLVIGGESLAAQPGLRPQPKANGGREPTGSISAWTERIHAVWNRWGPTCGRCPPTVCQHARKTLGAACGRNQIRASQEGQQKTSRYGDKTLYRLPTRGNSASNRNLSSPKFDARFVAELARVWSFRRCGPKP